MRRTLDIRQTECDSHAESGEHGVPATTRSTNPDFNGYNLCAECAEEYNGREPITENHDA